MSTRDSFFENYPRSRELIGDFSADLTRQEDEEWHAFILTRPEHDRWLQLKSEIDVARCCIVGGDISRSDDLRRRLIEEYYVYHRELYGVAQRWYAELIARKKQEQAAGAATP